MLQLAILRRDPQEAKDRLAFRHFKEPGLVDKILALDDKRKEFVYQFEDLKAKINLMSKEVGTLMAKGKNLTEEDAFKVSDNKMTVETYKNLLRQFDDHRNVTEKEMLEMLVRLPNLPAWNVPYGKTPDDNEVVRTGGTAPQLYSGAVPHWELAKTFDLINFELGNKITGSGFPVYKGKGAKLQRSLIHYFLDYNTAAGYTEYLPPFMVNETSAFGTGQLPDKEGQMYHATEDNLYLIPTAEVPVTNIYRDEILKVTDLPIKMTAYTPCFRREAGSYGKDVRGLNRVHQFDKVEIVQLVHPDRSYEVLEEMVEHVEKLLQNLGLHYRILRLCGGDMGFTSALTYDFEVWSAAQERWLEVSSVSAFESFQTNRMKIRFKDESNKMQLLHSLNGSSLALPRIMACLLENNQDENGIKLPVVLQSYFGSEMI